MQKCGTESQPTVSVHKVWQDAQQVCQGQDRHPGFHREALRNIILHVKSVLKVPVT